MKNTKSREFTLKADDLEVEYEYLIGANLLEEFLLEELEIPKEYIKSYEIDEEILSIKLTHGRAYFNDDWYVNLQRVS